MIFTIHESFRCSWEAYLVNLVHDSGKIIQKSFSSYLEQNIIVNRDKEQGAQN